MSTEQVTADPIQPTWFKSSYSGSGGGNCVEVAWVKSSYSGSGGGDCVEVARTPTTVHVRDSKSLPGPILHVTAEPWSAFITFTVTQQAAVPPGP
ncbi:DUF397 domain-containing protein [Streptomyces sp. NPDC096310]|uniref:DUF397 domain-containing protein n=1 Tax=Streptomyces sp. NPDC096310 TaxID=3366082 RepID=UPI0037FA9921